MAEDGYAAVTSRRVGTQATLKSQLVHYYFQTMDDLFIALYQRKHEQYMRLLQQMFLSDRPLTDLWRISMDESGPRISSEFMALAKHRPAVGAEIARTSETTRHMQAALITKAFKNNKISFDDLPPIALIMLMTSVTNLIHLESPIGLLSGHDEVIEAFERALRQVEDENVAPAA